MTVQRHRLTDLQRLDLPHNDHAHVWYCQLNTRANQIEGVRSCLTADELEQASRFISDPVRNRFVLGRGVLRTLLSCYLDKPPSEMELIVDPLGKPRLRNAALHFNVAHSGEWLVIGLASESEVGIDIEQHRRVKNWRGISESHFSDSERLAFLTDDTEQPPEAFFQVWTRKEAILKWHGTGLQTPLSSFDVPTGEPCSSWVELTSVEKKCWIESLDAPAGYSAAIATSQSCTEIVLLDIIQPWDGHSCPS